MNDGMVGPYPCLISGAGVPLVVLAGLSPDSGVRPGPLRRMHEQAARPWASGRQVFYINRRPGLQPGMTMGTWAAELAAALDATFKSPVDVLGLSTGGSIAQQLAAEHPDAVDRLVLISTACRLGDAARLGQRRAAARVDACAYRQALALMAAELVPRWRGQYLAAIAGFGIGPRLFSASDLRDMAVTIDAEDEFDLGSCPPVRSPTLLIAGARDRFYPQPLFAETAALIPDCQLSVHPKRGHVTVSADPVTIAETTAFLNSRVT